MQRMATDGKHSHNEATQLGQWLETSSEQNQT